jgi:hypothetical protein
MFLLSTKDLLIGMTTTPSYFKVFAYACMVKYMSGENLIQC